MKSRLARWAPLIETFAGISAGVEIAQKARNSVRRNVDRAIYRVSISDRDPLYPTIHDLLLPKVATNRVRSLAAQFQRDATSPAARFSYTGKSPHLIKIDGYWVWVMFKAEDPNGGGTEEGLTIKGLTLKPSDEAMSDWLKDANPRYLVIACPTVGARDAVTRWVEQAAGDRRDQANPPRFHIPRWGGWRSQSSLADRPLDTVIMPDGLIEDLVDDLETFFKSRETYERLGLPWHRGYLLYGPPGCGKTSLVLALARHFDQDMWYLPLSEIADDSGLLNLAGSIEGGFFLAEDVDVLHAAQERTTEDEGDAVNVTVESAAPKITLSGLLNTLDGIATPAGLVTFLTTNRYHVLDEALVREGRVDRPIEISYAADRQIERAFEHVYGFPLDEPIPTDRLEVGMNSVMEAFKPHLHDAAAGRVALLRRLTEGR